MFFEYGEYVKNSAVYADMIQTMREEVKDFTDTFHDDPRLLSGWGHGYFCNDDGARLIYDRKNPLRHTCSICKKVYTDFAYSSYFITMYRNEAVETAVKAAVLYRLDKKVEYLDTVKKIIGFYAENYKYFGVHAKDKLNCAPDIDPGGAGKIMPQGLNEAIIAIRFINAMELVKDDLDKEWIKQTGELLFEEIYKLLLPQKMRIHNIPIWLNSAFGIMGLFFDREDWIKEATENPFNIYEQLENGLTEDGFWYEGSIHYNFFALEGLMTFYVFASTYGYEIPEKYLNKVKHMLFAAYDYAFDNDIFPNPSDGWPNIGLKTYSYVYFMGYKVFGEDILPLLKHISEGKIERGKLPLSEPYYYNNSIPLAQLLYAADFMDKENKSLEVRTGKSFPSFNCGLLRNEYFNVFLKYGHQTKSHAHPDKMNVEIMVKDKILTKDLSNSGYGTIICNKWDRTIAAHNTCAVNGLSMDVTNPGELLTFEKNCMEAKADAYPGVAYNRKIVIDGCRMYDTFSVDCEEESTIDWFFHFETPLKKDELSLSPAENELPEYDMLMNLRRISVNGSQLALENDLAEMQIDLEEGTKLYLADTYNNPADQQRETIIIRKQSKKACFANVIQAK